MIGIDLGTTNSLVCVWEENGVRLIKNRFGDTLTPSIVSFDSDGTIYVGKTAKERLVTHPETIFREFKRDMGTDVKFKAYDQTYTPEELSALILKQLKEDAEFELGHPVEEVVISVPAYFDDKQRAATRNAGLLAGLKVERLINEPSAAALSYHIEHYDEDEMFVVFDFGGGTLDVLSRAITRFEEALNRQSPVVIERAYRTFTVQLTMLEASMFSFHAFDKQQWEKTFEDDYNEKECAEDAGE